MKSHKPFIHFDEALGYFPLEEIAFLAAHKNPHELSSQFQRKNVLEKYAEIKRKLLKLLGAAEEDTLLLTNSFNEAINLVFSHHLEKTVLHSGNQHILLSAVESAPIMQAAERLKAFGCEVSKIIPNSSGMITKESLLSKITKRTKLLSLSWVNPLLSSIQPLHEIAKICAEHQIDLHIDISHAIGKLLFRFDEIPAKYVTFSPKTFQGYFKQGVLLTKEKMQADSLSSLYLEDFLMLDKALSCAIDQLEHVNLEIARMRNYFEKKLIRKFPEIVSIFQNIERLPSTCLLSFPHVKNEYLLYLLQSQNLFASIGGEGFQKLESSLGVLGIDAKIASSAICFSFSSNITQEKVEEAIATLAECYEKAKKTSHALFNLDLS